MHNNFINNHKQPGQSNQIRACGAGGNGRETLPTEQDGATGTNTGERKTKDEVCNSVGCWWNSCDLDYYFFLHKKKSQKQGLSLPKFFLSRFFPCCLMFSCCWSTGCDAIVTQILPEKMKERDERRGGERDVADLAAAFESLRLVLPDLPCRRVLCCTVDNLVVASRPKKLPSLSILVITPHAHVF